MARLTGRTYAAFLGGFFGLLGLAVYPTMIQPMINPEPYKRNRERIFSKPANS